MKKILSLTLALTFILSMLCMVIPSASAADGDLLYTADFRSTDFTTLQIDTAKREGSYAEPSADGTSVTLHGASTPTSGGVFFWGSKLEGLAVTATSKYTVEYKFKTSGQYAGALLLAGDSSDNEKACGSMLTFYGAFYTDTTKAAMTISRNTKTGGYTANNQLHNGYVTPANPKVDSDGFYNLKVSFDGYLVSAYFETTDGVWMPYAVFTLEEQDQTATTNLYCGAYNYQNTAVVTLKDYKVYQGITVESPLLKAAYGTPTLDAVKDDIYAETSKVASTYKDAPGSSIEIYYANDSEYLYVFTETISTVNIPFNDDDAMFRSYIDFVNKDSYCVKYPHTVYESAYFPSSGATKYNGGQFQFKPTSATEAAFSTARTKFDTSAVKYSVKVDGKKLSIEIAIPLPDGTVDSDAENIASIVESGKTYTIGVGYEGRIETSTEAGKNARKGAVSDTNAWRYYSTGIDLVLAGKPTAGGSTGGSGSTETNPGTGDASIALVVCALLSTAALGAVVTKKRSSAR